MASAELSANNPGTRPAKAAASFSRAAWLVLILGTILAIPLVAQGDTREAAAKLVARTMSNPEFRPKFFRGGEWYGNGDSYLALEPSA